MRTINTRGSRSAEEAEWLSYFTAENAKVQALQTQIAKTDKEIDGMVYEFYGLTAGEVKAGGEVTLSWPTCSSRSTVL